jgi:hypothetical protein
MTLEEVVEALESAGHIPHIRAFRDKRIVHAAFERDEEGYLRAPVVIVFVDSRGRWVLTGYQGDYYQVPDERVVPAAAIDAIRAMGYCMFFAPEVIKKYNLIELDPAEFEPDDE